MQVIGPSAVLVAGIVTLCILGGAGGVHGLEFTGAEVVLLTNVLTVIFDGDVDPASVDASKFYLGGHGTDAGRVALTGAAAAPVNGSAVSFTLTSGQMSAIRGISPLYLTADAGAVADGDGNPIGAQFDPVDVRFEPVRLATKAFLGPRQADAYPGIEFNNDGTRLFVGFDDHIREYSLSTAFDLPTISYLRNSTTLGEFGGQFTFSPNGTSLYVGAGSGPYRIDRYDLPAPFDIATMAKAESMDAPGAYTPPYGIALSPDGSKIFYADEGVIFAHNLTSPFSLSGASDADEFLPFENQTGIYGEKAPIEVEFNGDGTEMYVVNCGERDIWRHTLPAPYDLFGPGAELGELALALGQRYEPHAAAAVDLTGDTIDAGAQDPQQVGQACSIAFSGDGSRMFVSDNRGVTTAALSGGRVLSVAEFYLGSLEAGIVNDPPAVDAGAAQTVYEGQTVALSGTASDPEGRALEYAWTHDRPRLGIVLADDAALSTTFVAPQVASSTNVTFTLTATDGYATSSDTVAITVRDGVPDCTDMPPPTGPAPGDPATRISSVLLDEGAGTLTIRFDAAIDAGRVDPAGFGMHEAGSATATITFSAADAPVIVDQHTISFELGEDRRQAAISMDDPRLVVADSAVYTTGGDAFAGYVDVSSAAHAGAVFNFTRDRQPTDITFGADGASMFITGDHGDRIYAYSLGSPFDASSAAFERELGTFKVDRVPNAVAFSPDGTCMYLAGNWHGSVYQYGLGSAFEPVSRYTGYQGGEVKASFGTGSRILADLEFSGDGSRMLTLDRYGTNVHQYGLGSHFDISEAVPGGSLYVGDRLDRDRYMSMALGPGGTTLLVLGFQQIHQYDLAAPYELGGAVHAAEAALYDGTGRGLAIDSTGTRMFVMDAWDVVHEYALGHFTVSTVPDGDGPAPVSAAVDGSAVTVTFNEVIKPGRATIQIVSSDYSESLDITPNPRTASGSTLAIALTTWELEQASDMDGPLLRIYPTSVYDTSGNPVSYEIALDALTTEPTPPPVPTTPLFNYTGNPQFVSGAFHALTGTLAISFDEPVHASGADPARLAITNGSGSSSVPLDGAAPASSTNSTNIAVRLTDAQKQSVAGLGTDLLLDIGRGAVHDLAGNPVDASTGNPVATSDQEPPTVASATYGPSSQLGLPFHTYTITFSEILGDRVNLHGVRIGANLSHSIQLQNLGLSTRDGDTITADTNQLADVHPPRLFITAGAVKDLFGNSVAATDMPFTFVAGNAQLVGTSEQPLTTSNAQATNSTTPTNTNNNQQQQTKSTTPTNTNNNQQQQTKSTTPPNNNNNQQKANTNPDNSPPTADAGSALVIASGARATITGWATDLDSADALTYQWLQNPSDAGVIFGSPNSLTTTVTAPEVDTVTQIALILRVSDGAASDFDAMLLVVTPSSAP